MSKINYVTFIISHGRADKIKTIDSLKRVGFNGPYFIVIDDQDNTRAKYIENFGEDKIIVFDKLKYALSVDNGDNFKDYRSTTHARNACFDIAKKLGYEYFLVLDDDYTKFQWRFNDQYEYCYKWIKNFNVINESIFKFLKTTPFHCIAIAQGGDFIGGSLGGFAKKVLTKRKIMNGFYCSTAESKSFNFFSRLNEDVNTYIKLGSVGYLFLTINQLSLEQLGTQQNQGGMTDAYLKYGTYVKSFYSVLYNPSSVSISMLHTSNKRIHHRISWKHTVPKIIDEKYKKVGSIKADF